MKVLGQENGFEAWSSIQLSYGHVRGRSVLYRTNQVRLKRRSLLEAVAVRGESSVSANRGSVSRNSVKFR